MPGSTYAALPLLLRELARHCGITVAMTLIDWRGNQRLYVPCESPPDGHELVVRLGRHAADWLVHECGGQTLMIPLAAAVLREARDEEIRQLKGKLRAPEAALRYGLRERQIWRIWAELQEAPAATPQVSLL